MSQQERDFEDLVRWALHSTADSVEPSQDGLERIRGRLTRPYPLPVAWMMAVYSQAARWTRGGLDSLGSWLAPVPGSARQRRRVTRPSPSRGRRPSRVVLAAALAGAFAAAIGVGALTPPLRQAIVQTGLLIRSITSGSSGSSSRPPVSGHGRKLLPSGGAVSGMASGTGSHQQPNPANCAARQPVLATTPTSPATSATTTASPSPTACATLTTGPTAASPSPASSSSPSPTPTSPSPSPTPTSSSPSPTPTSSSPSPTPTSSSPSPTPTSSSPSLAPGSSSPSPIPSATAGLESPSAAKPASSESLGDQPRH
jgi:hypothetical protein